MSSPRPINAQGFGGLSNEGLSESFDRSSSLARLQDDTIFSTSPGNAPSRLGHDLTPVESHHSGYSQSGHPNEDSIARAVKRHLVDPSSLQPSASSSPTSSTVDITRTHSHNASVFDDAGSVHSSHYTSSIHQLPGASVTHEIYKWTDNMEDQLSRRKRTQSVSLQRSAPSDPHLARLRDPGGFRRHFLASKASKLGRQPPNWMARTFTEFLALYGHFGGEDLSDEEGDDSDDEGYLGHATATPDEETPLIQQEPPQGNVTASKAVFLLIKAFFGTGPMFLPKAFANGGLTFSCVLLTFIAVVSLYSFLLLVETRNKVPMSFGDIGGHLYGPLMRYFVLASIAISQVGFVCAYMVFVGQNVQALLEAVSNCEWAVPLSYLIWGQIAVFVPLAMIRKIQKLSVFALLADVFIMLGVLYLFYYDFLTLGRRGIADVEWVINPVSFPMFVGTAVFTFEGVGLVIPITESMKHPEQFPRVLTGTMIGLAAVFLAVGSVSYLTFGKEVQTVILLNLPVNPLVNVLQGLYALAICLSIPLQLFPAIRIIETGLFTRSGKYNPVVKWEKNILRFGIVVVCAVVATAGSQDLDKFVSVIGSVCCVPLCFLFPPLFHYRAIATTFRQKAIDLSIIAFSLVCMVYTTMITISLWFDEAAPAPPVPRCTPH
ncbi:hypothetical protein DM01DRAFT_1365946 [Hesseltinella vesiculosa]|uniref:Amino acid transporter transmembrane domain-containing protein n=1 Tax=Hesseltinella vesiculosa TaxID=101127 RepID=A0A1X2GQR4_9FUNG|nr:hypothetical protein DM01DRAFT_1365946 [Hesseltinella vesiculosa]